MQELQKLPLMKLQPSQQAKVGSDRVKETKDAQSEARGLSQVPGLVPCELASAVTWCRHFLGDADLDAAGWERLAMLATASGVFQCGNHVCLDRVCYKGRWAKIRFCRMLYWHWARSRNRTGKEVMRRRHGLLLQPAWDGRGLPPIQTAPPNPGLPLLEMNFPFFFKLCFAVLLGPACNHDLGLLLRLPVLTDDMARKLQDDSDAHPGGGPSELDQHLEECAERVLARMTGRDLGSQSHNAVGDVARQGLVPRPIGDVEWQAAFSSSIESMTDSIVDHEYYASDYVTKAQPHAEGLLQTLHDSKVRHERYRCGNTDNVRDARGSSGIADEMHEECSDDDDTDDS